MSGEPLRAGVLGVGHMGRHHARVYSELSAVDLVGVYDIDEERARAVADRTETETVDLPRLLNAVDIASIAVPTEAHVNLTRRCIEANVDVLVEKPFVTDPADGERLEALATEQGVVLQVGHIERFNPAVTTLSNLLPGVEVLAIDANRLGPPTDRDHQDDVVADLMIHDLDVVLSLLDSEVASVDGHLVRGGRYGTATIGFDDETIATFTASRSTQRKVRELVVTTADSVIYLDYMDRSVEIHHRSSASYVEEKPEITQRHESVIERVYVEDCEPLMVELSAFADAVRERSEPRVTAADGIRVVSLVNRIREDANDFHDP